MTRYQLAKLIEWAGKLRSRKRMQKLVYLVQIAGCPFEADFLLHHYGPYSQDVARLTDEMVGMGLLREEATPNAKGQQFDYELTDHARERVAALESQAEGATLRQQIERYEAMVRELAKIDVRDLEVAATIVYFHRQGHVLHEAVVKACQFKNLPPDGGLAARATELAKKFAA